MSRRKAQPTTNTDVQPSEPQADEPKQPVEPVEPVAADETPVENESNARDNESQAQDGNAQSEYAVDLGESQMPDEAQNMEEAHPTEEQQTIESAPKDEMPDNSQRIRPHSPGPNGGPVRPRSRYVTDRPTSPSGRPLKIYVANLPNDITDDELRTTFEKFGTVLHVEIKANARYAFVHFQSGAAAEEAVRNMHGQPLRNANLHVEPQKPLRAPAASRGGRGFDRGPYPPKGRGPPRSSDPSCFNCGDLRHWAKDCPEPYIPPSHRPGPYYGGSKYRGGPMPPYGPRRSPPRYGGRHDPGYDVYGPPPGPYDRNDRRPPPPDSNYYDQPEYGKGDAPYPGPRDRDPAGRPGRDGMYSRYPDSYDEFSGHGGQLPPPPSMSGGRYGAPTPPPRNPGGPEYDDGMYNDRYRRGPTGGPADRRQAENPYRDPALDRYEGRAPRRERSLSPVPASNDYSKKKNGSIYDASRPY